MEQNLPAQDSIVSVNNQNLKSSEKPKRKIHIPKIAILIGFFIFLLILMESGLYLAKKSNTNSSITPSPVQATQASPTPNPSEDWEISYSETDPAMKIYKNIELGYSFEAPIDWNYAFDPEANAIMLQSPDLVINKLDDRRTKGSEIMIRSWVTDAKTPQEFLDNYYNEPRGGLSGKPLTTKIKIDGIDALLYDGSAETLFVKDGNMYNARIDFYNLEADDIGYERKELPTYQKLLSSFKFNDPDVSCTPRPSCLDTNPRCLIAETEDMCPPTPSR